MGKLAVFVCGIVLAAAPASSALLAEAQQPRRALSAVAPAPAPGAANALQSLLSTAANEQTAEVQDLDQVMAQLQSEAAQEDQQTQQSEQGQAQSDDAQQNHQLTQQEAGATNLATQHPKIPTLASFAPSPPPPPRAKGLKKKEKEAEMSGSIASGTAR